MVFSFIIFLVVTFKYFLFLFCFEVICKMAGSRPTHKGTVTVKDGDDWKKIGDVVVWADNADGSVSGQVTIAGVTSNFRAWKA